MSESSVTSFVTSSTLDNFSNCAFNSIFSFVNFSISAKNVSLTTLSIVFFALGVACASTSSSTSGASSSTTSSSVATSFISKIIPSTSTTKIRPSSNSYSPIGTGIFCSSSVTIKTSLSVSKVSASKIVIPSINFIVSNFTSIPKSVLI